MAIEISKQQKSKRRIDYLGIFTFIAALVVLLCFYPYEFYSAYLFTPTNLSSTLYLSLIVVVVGLTMILYRRKPDMPKSIWFIVAFQCIGYVFCSYAKGEGLPTGPLMMVVLSVTLILFLSATSGLKNFYHKYNRWILIMAALGTLALFLVWAGALSPLMSFIDLSDEDLMYNYGLTFSQRNQADQFQYCGFFDEPGTMASWGMYALLFNRLFIKEKRLEYILIITLIATFSLGFYIQLVAYILMFFFLNKNNGKGIISVSLFLIVLTIIVLVLYSFEGTQYDEIYQKTIARIETTLNDSWSGGGLAVGDREDLTINAQKEFEANPIWGTSRQNVELGNNIYEPLAQYGIIGTFFVYFPFLYILIISLQKRDYNLLKCFIVIFLGFTHRPFHLNLLSFFIIYSFIVLYHEQRRITKSQSSYL